ncbi:DegT/DnrJ/EryC1/StrS family aminotransferase [Fulvivirgaceae bacterium BMA10]|uniref:DegT/DnrJ/EryC1/StrS family aminotransferase n=1 Tax=Splendidivirga corallicola TaxID=3051826 RepID=A0ABT8KX80_9BACT|nr:DegT/DnrJ/EryC1/StrS family aminotransferase [Fulvivirgaceae bacterium BMA10]
MIPFSPPFVDEDVIKEVTDSLNSGWITTGPKVKALEEEVAAYTGVSNALCVNSMTSGLMLMLRWFGVEAGDEVIVPAYTYSATALAVMNIGGTPVMVDIEDDFSISVDKIREAINERTKVIVPVDIAGWPCDYDAINALVRDPEIVSLFSPSNEAQRKLGRIVVISDSAHSIGACYKGKKTGLLTDVTIFSFHAVKNVTTAEGGGICLNLPKPFDNQEVYDFLRVYSLNGQTKDAFTKTKAGGWRYDIIYQGLKINMPDICAAIGLVQLKKYNDDLLKERKRVFEHYNDIFSVYDWAILPPYENEERRSSCHIYPLRIKEITEEQRDEIIDHITEEGVSVNVHFVPMPMLTLFKNEGFDINDYPNTFKQYKGEISLPIYPQLTDREVSIVGDAVIKSYQKVVC